ncbi:MAG: asparagine synthase [Acidobacteria bacterium]|nr:asparagine synthase [Acidobacteriota bacterium]
MNAFIGFWGHAKIEDVDQQLSQVLAQVGDLPHYLKQNYGQVGVVTGIATWGKYVNASLKEGVLTTSLAASGLMSEASVKVAAQSNLLKLTRDEFGRAALFWMQQKSVVWFASHLQLLLPLLEDITISAPALYGYACFSYVPTPLTPLKSIFTVPAGATGKFQLGRGTPPSLEVNWLKENEDWQESTLPQKQELQTSQKLQKLLTGAIQKQLSDVPTEGVGLFLSGGLDSAIVAALLAREGVKVQAYTLDFGAFGVSEVQHAERVAEYLKIPLVKVAASPDRIKQAIPATAKALDMPYGDGVTVPLFLLNQVASQECSIVFNGEGGDQLFGGWTNKPLIASDVYQSVHPQEHTAGMGFLKDYLRTFHRLYSYEKDVFTANIYDQIKSVDPLQWMTDALDDLYTHSLLHRLRRANLMLKGAQNIQPRATNLAFAFDLAVRTPFCDPELTKWTFQVASDLLLRESHEKYLLKRAVEIWLPPEIVWREKRGMGVPLTQWCLEPLWREVGEWLQPSVLRDEGLWQEDLALRISSGNLSGQIQGRRIGETLWLLMMWQVWRKTILQEDFKRSSLQPFLLPSKFWRWRFNRR